MMLETARTKCQLAMDSSDKISKKEKSLDKKTHNLLEKALPSMEMPEKKRKLKVRKILIKSSKANHWEKTKVQFIW